MSLSEITITIHNHLCFYNFFLLTSNSSERKNITYKNQSSTSMKNSNRNVSVLCSPKRPLPCEQSPSICSQGKRLPTYKKVLTKRVYLLQLPIHLLSHVLTCSNAGLINNHSFAAPCTDLLTLLLSRSFTHPSLQPLKNILLLLQLLHGKIFISCSISD